MIPIARASVFCLSLLLLAACAASEDDSSSGVFVVRSTNVATSSSTPIAISGARIAFLAAEDETGDGGTDFNDDDDVADQIAHVVDTSSGEQFRLRVAAEGLAWAGSHLYLVVDEAADENDWNDDEDEEDAVLLHWSEAADELRWVDDLASAEAAALIALDGRVLYVSADPGALAGDSALRFVEPSDPLTPIPVGSADPDGPLAPSILGADEGLVFLALDETVELRDLNGDTDDEDTAVLALLDGTSSASVLRSTLLSVDPDSPFRAKARGKGDWRVAFLVDERDQGSESRNSSAVGANFRPGHCAGDDRDDGDQVLCLLEFADWDADPRASPPINHGLAGRDRIALANGFVATIVAESDDDCDLNDDGDDDVVVRWLAVATDEGDPILPINDPDDIWALVDVPGGSHGLAELSGRFVIVASESEGGDIDANDARDSDLVGWLEPSGSSSTWSFFHTAGSDSPVATTWIGARGVDGYLGVALAESLNGASLNQGSSSSPTDTDALDSIATFAIFSGSDLVFPGVPIAVDSDAAGIAIAKNVAFYRVSEAEDSRDRNGDLDQDDFILLRTNLSTGATVGMSVVGAPARPAITVATQGSIECAALLALESQQGQGGTDFNGDGDEDDLVLRWFRF